MQNMPFWLECASYADNPAFATGDSNSVLNIHQIARTEKDPSGSVLPLDERRLDGPA